MQVGCLGNIIFEVSSSTIRTISAFTNTGGTANYAIHARVGAKELPEFTGLSLDKCEIEIVLSSYLGVNPFTEVRKIKRAKNSGKKMRLVIGNDYYGRFVITSYEQTATSYDRSKGVTVCTVRISIMEYPED